MKKTTNKTMGSILKHFRENAGYSIDDLSRYFHGNAQLILDWELEKVEPTLSESLLLSRLYGISLDEMFAHIDIQPYIPSEAAEDYERATRLNRMACRWYN